MLNNLKVLRRTKDVNSVLYDEMAIPMACTPEDDKEFLVIDMKNGYREGTCPKCGARIYAHGFMVGHDKY